MSSQSKIVTVTLNPSLDETITINHLNLGYHNRSADTIQLDASGRGVNVSSALSHMGINTHAIILLGNDAIGHAYKGLINEQPFKSTIIRHEKHTRSDTILYDQSDDVETHIIDDSTGVDEASIEELIKTLREMVKPDDYVVLAGTLPREVPIDTYGKIAESIQDIGAKIILMAGSDPITPALKFKPEMVVLTRLETESYFNYPVRNVSDMLVCGNKLMEKGTEKVLVIADDFTSAVFTNDQKINLRIQTDNSGTDSGVIDAMIAGYLCGLQHGKTTAEALQLGAASLIYTSNEVGNKFGNLSRLQELTQYVIVEDVNTDMSVADV